MKHFDVYIKSTLYKRKIVDLILSCSLYDEIKKATKICNKINVADSNCNYSCTIPNLVGEFIKNVY